VVEVEAKEVGGETCQEMVMVDDGSWLGSWALMMIYSSLPRPVGRNATVFHAEADVAISGLNSAWVSIHYSWTLLRAFLAWLYASFVFAAAAQLAGPGSVAVRFRRVSQRFLFLMPQLTSPASPCVISAL
jgi:hypothetical protein